MGKLKGDFKIPMHSEEEKRKIAEMFRRDYIPPGLQPKKEEEQPKKEEKKTSKPKLKHTIQICVDESTKQRWLNMSILAKRELLKKIRYALEILTIDK